MNNLKSESAVTEEAAPVHSTEQERHEFNQWYYSQVAKRKLYITNSRESKTDLKPLTTAFEFQQSDMATIRGPLTTSNDPGLS